MTKRVLLLNTLITIILFTQGCSNIGSQPIKENIGLTSSPKSTSTASLAPEEISSLPPTLTREEILSSQSLWISDSVPSQLKQNLQEIGAPLTSNRDQATIQLDGETNGLQQPAINSTWIYSFVAPFPTEIDEITSTQLNQAWMGDPTSIMDGVPIWMEVSTLKAFTSVWGPPGSNAVIKTAETGKLLESAWENQPSFAIIPFEEIESRWKVLSIDGQSPVHNDFDPSSYPLILTFSLSGDNADLFADILPKSNRDPEKMTILVMTGVTALVRATAEKMEVKGRTYPGEAIRDWLINADLTHISNEVPFAQNCPYPDPSSPYLFFCSDPRNIELLDYIGTDIIELTGNHFQDWGSEATLFTIDLYNKRHWPYFGGGINALDARKSIKLENHGNKIAFIGCNPSGPAYAWATDTEPGAARCDMNWMTEEIQRLKSEGYIPIATFQYYEGYSAWPGLEQTRDFRMMTDAGAVIVSGSQAHFPMTMEFYEDSFIHYGLGNLFFDQMDYPVVGTRREFIDRHIFYNGKHINTELLTALLEDYARPRPMTPDERTIFLSDIFMASGW